jgi:hypothetical protein
MALEILNKIIQNMGCHTTCKSWRNITANIIGMNSGAQSEGCSQKLPFQLGK